MITIELNHLKAENALTAALGTVEGICDEYSLNNQFGTLSLAVTEMLNSIFACAQDCEAEVDINFQIDKKDVTVEFHTDCNLEQIRCEVGKGDSANDAIYTIMRLADTVTFPSDCDIRMEFVMQPHFATANIENVRVHSEQTYSII